MKKRIIAALLVLVMTVLALVSCGFDLAEEDLTVYTDGTFDAAKFMEALKKIEIEDGEYTTDAAINDLVIKSDIYDGLATSIIADIGTAGKDDGEEDKLKEGTIASTDVVYYCYYITYKDENGKVHEFKRSEMNESTMSSSTTSAAHVIRLGTYTTDKFQKKLAEVLAGKDIKTYAYSMDSTKNATVKVTDIISVSYTMVETVDNKKVTYKAVSQFIDLSNESDELAKALADSINGGNAIKVDSSNAVKFPVAGTTNSTTNKLTVGNKEYSDIKVEYIIDSKGSEILIEDFELEDTLGTNLPYNELYDTASTPSSVTLDKGKKVTYHIYPVYRVEIPEAENVANAIIRYVYASKLSTLLDDSSSSSSFAFGSTVRTALNEILNDAEYKYTEGDTTKTAKELTGIIAKLWKSDFSDEAFKSLKDLSTAVSTADTEYNKKITAEKTAKEAYDKAVAAEKTAKEAWEKAAEADKAAKKEAYDAAVADTAAKKTAYNDAETATDNAEKAVDDAKDALETARLAAIDAEIAKLTKAKKGEDVLGTKMTETLDEELRHSRKEEYDADISDKIAQAVFDVIDEMVKVTSYPEKLVKDFSDHLYDSYEYDYYNGKYSSSSSTSQSNFSYYQDKGKLDGFLKAELKEAGYLTSDLESKGKEGIEAAINKEAEHFIEPLIKIYVVSKALDNYDFSSYNYGKTADDVFVAFVNKDIEAKLPSYWSYYFNDDEISAKDNERIKEKREKSAEEYRESALESASHFFIDKEGFKAYKKSLGAKSYRNMEQSEGEINIRAELQLNNLFTLLLSTNQSVDVDEEEEHVHTEVNYVEVDGKKYHDYRLIDYKIVDSTASDSKD